MSVNDLLPLIDIVRPKSLRPNLVENVNDALTDPARTLRDYLFTPGIRGYFERIFQDVKDQRGGGYWVQAEYGGGKTHFLSSLLCLLAEGTDDDAERLAWENVSDSELRSDWERVLRPRKLLGAHMSLMGTTAVIGSEQPNLVDLIDSALVEALGRHGHDDPGISASMAVLDWVQTLAPAIRSEIERGVIERFRMPLDEYRDETDDTRAAKAVLVVASSLGLKPDVQLQVQDHVRHALDRLKSLGFDGAVIVIDEYLSREQVLSDAQKDIDGAVLETIGYKLGQQAGLPLYLFVASQGPMPAKLQSRFQPMALLKDQEREYSQIVCKRIMDYLPPINDQAILYHEHFRRSFSFLRRTTSEETRQIFPFQPAIFRYLRDLVSSDRIGNIPSARFAIGTAYDTVNDPNALDVKRFLTIADLLGESLEREILASPQMKDAAAALRQARDFIDNSEWDVAYLPEFAHRVLDHLFLDSVVRDQPQTLEQIVDGTLIEAPGGMLPPKDVAKAVLKKLQNCEQIDFKDNTWRFASRVVEGEQFETIFQKAKRDVKKDDPRLEPQWIGLLTAPINATGGILAFLSSIVSPLRAEVDYCGMQYQARAVYAANSLASSIEDIKRLTQPERARVVFVPKPLEVAPAITDSAIAVVAPGHLNNETIDELRGVVACQDILSEYKTRTEIGADKIKATAESKSRELTKSLLGRQRDAYKSGEIFTKDSLALPTKDLFRENLKTGFERIAQQLISHAYPKTGSLVNAKAANGSIATADAQKIFDGIFGGVTDARSKGAAEKFGPVLGLTAPANPSRLVAQAGPGPDAIAAALAATLPDAHMDDVYDRFCNEPYGLSTNVVDLLTLACVALGKPHAIELHPNGALLETRDRHPYRGTIRASQLRLLAWPKDGLRGFSIAPSKEVTWNDIAPIARAIDPGRFTLASDSAQVQAQEGALLTQLNQLESLRNETGKALQTLREASNSNLSPEATATLVHIRDFAALRNDFSRETILKFANETYGESDGTYSGLKEDVQRLQSLAQLVGETARLAGLLHWFRALSANAPESLEPDIEIAKPLMSLEFITSSAGQAGVAMQTADELHAKFMNRFRTEHSQWAQWVERQRQALEAAQHRLPTLERLNKVPPLGPPQLAAAKDDVTRLLRNFTPCEHLNAPDVGQGISCLSCRYQMGQLAAADPVGERAKSAIDEAIQSRSRALSQGLIAEALKAVGDDSLTKLLVAAQAGSFDDIIEKDLLSDDLVSTINEVLKGAKQQTVPSARVYDFIETHPSITAANVDGWLAQLKTEIMVSLADAKQANPGKEITLLLKAGDVE